MTKTDDLDKVRKLAEQDTDIGALARMLLRATAPADAHERGPGPLHDDVDDALRAKEAAIKDKKAWG